MNLQKLFKAQKQLDDHIVKEKGLEGQDLLDKKILALQVELGELANEWEMFKFWKENPKPNTKEPITAWGKPYRNPLLEEYVDGLHFLLSIGLEIGIRPDEVKDLHIWNADGTSQFNSLFAYASELYTFHWSAEYTKEEMISKYINLSEGLLGLGIYGLGFTWEQIEQAYFAKNKINFERQANGY